MSAGAAPETLSIDIISDVVCPWCYVGKRRLEKAAVAVDMPLTVRWLPYQLDPTIPPEGKPRRAYLKGKFGSEERIRHMHESLVATGAAEGIAFAFDRIEVSPNTLDAHRLVRWAGEAGAQDPVVEALFRAYFVDGQDIGSHEVLAAIAGSAGMSAASLHARLDSEEDCEAVRQEVSEAQRIGVTGVPTFIVDRRYALVGAQPAEQIAEALKTIANTHSARPAHVLA